MSYDTARKLLTDAFTAAWAAGGELFPVQIDNQKFDKPKGQTWGRWSINWGENNQQALGQKLTRAQGAAWLQVFIPDGGGTRDAMLAADKLASALNQRQLTEGNTHVQVRTWAVRPSGPSDGKQQWTCWVTFYADSNP